jgi:hypothetical protein
MTNYQDHAFLYQNGAMIDLNSLISTNSGWELYSAFGINNSDQIVGWGSLDGGEHFRSFILEVPEPSTGMLMAGAVAALLIFRSRHGYSLAGISGKAQPIETAEGGRRFRRHFI